MRSMLALQPVWEVTTAHGEEPRRRETTTDSTFAPSTSVTQVQPLLGDVDELLLLEIRQVGHRDLVDGLGEEQHLETLLEQALREGGGLGGVLGGGGQEEDPLLALLHAGDVVRQGRLLLAVRRGKAEELGQSFAVGGVFDHPELEVPPEGLPARELLQRVERPLHELLPDDARDPGLLEDLAAHVQREIGRVYDALHEAEVPGHQTVVKLVRDEHALDIELDVPGLHRLAALVEAGRARDEDHPRELDGALHVEVVVRHGIEELLEGALEERVVLLLLDLLGAAEPQRLRVVLRRPVEDRVVLGLHHGVHRLGLLALSEGLV